MYTCNTCLDTKTHKDFYDSNKSNCKDCIKAKSKLQRDIKISTPKGLEQERQRHREKYHRLGYKDIHKPSAENKAEIIKRYKEKYPEKQKAKIATNSLNRTKGNHLHHWSYNGEHYKDCIEMDIENHAKLHRFLKYDLTSFFYRTTDGKILDTKEKHLEYIKFLGIEIHEYKN